MTGKNKTCELEARDFMLGTLNAAAEVDPKLRLRRGNTRVDEAFHQTFRKLIDMIGSGEADDIDPVFNIVPDRIFGDSPTVADGIRCLITDRYLIEQTSRVYGFTPRFRQTAEDVFATIPSGTPELFRGLGPVFLDSLTSDS